MNLVTFGSGGKRIKLNDISVMQTTVTATTHRDGNYTELVDQLGQENQNQYYPGGITQFGGESQNQYYPGDITQFKVESQNQYYPEGITQFERENQARYCQGSYRW